MAPSRCDNTNDDSEMATAMQLIAAQAQLIQAMAQSLANNNEQPPGVPQLLESQSQLLQMMNHRMANNEINLTERDYEDNYVFEADVVTKPQSCKICGDIGHTYREHCNQCPHCDGSHPAEECPTSQVTCFLCEGTNHVPAQCRLFPVVQQVSQQVKDEMPQTLGKILGDRRSTMKAEAEVKSEETTLNVTTKCYYTRGEDGPPTSNRTRKRERSPTFVVEYEEKELRDLLALQKPKRKMNQALKKTHGDTRSKKKDISQVVCYNCKKSGHYASNCPEKKKNAKHFKRNKTNHLQKGCYAKKKPKL